MVFDTHRKGTVGTQQRDSEEPRSQHDREPRARRIHLNFNGNRNRRRNIRREAR